MKNRISNSKLSWKKFKSKLEKTFRIRKSIFCGI